jgi:hypothetical protein
VGIHPVSVVAYANDVTNLIMSVTEFQAIEDAKRLFEKASVAWENPKQSQALSIGQWKNFDTVLEIANISTMRILGMRF